MILLNLCKFMPFSVRGNMAGDDHSNMAGDDHSNMAGNDHSNMAGDDLCHSSDSMVVSSKYCSEY